MISSFQSERIWIRIRFFFNTDPQHCREAGLKAYTTELEAWKEMHARRKEVRTRHKKHEKAGLAKKLFLIVKD